MEVLNLLLQLSGHLQITYYMNLGLKFCFTYLFKWYIWVICLHNSRLLRCIFKSALNVFVWYPYSTSFFKCCVASFFSSSSVSILFPLNASLNLRTCGSLTGQSRLNCRGDGRSGPKMLLCHRKRGGLILSCFRFWIV